MSQALVKPKDVHADETTGVVKVQGVCLLQGYIEAGAIEGSEPKLERVAGVSLFREMTESYVGYMRLLGP